MSISCHSSSQAASSIFITSKGQPLKVFIESVSVEDRRRLIKLLESHGAQICYGVGDAHIILVNPDSEAGRNLARNWGKEPGKVVLDVIWVYRCKEEGRALLNGDNWGGFNEIDITAFEDDDGLDVDEVSDSETKATRKRKRSPERAQTSQKVQSTPAAAQAAHLSAPPSAAGPSQSQGNGLHIIDKVNTAIQQSQAQPSLNYSFFQQQPQSVGPVAYIDPSGPMQLFHAFFANSGTPQMLSGQFNQPQLIPQHSGQYHPVQAQPAQGHPYSHSDSQAQSISTRAYVDVSPRLNLATDQQHASLSEEEIERDIQPSLRRRKMAHESKNISANRIQKNGKSISTHSRETRPLLQDDFEARSHASANTSSVFIEDDTRQVSSSAESSQRLRPSPPRISQAPPSGGFFTDENGEQMLFYVQTDLRERQQLLSVIKRNGGTITPDMEDATYVILSSDEKPHAKKLLKTATVYGRTALKYHFIQACAKQGAFLDVEPYSLNQIRGRPKHTKVKAQSKASPKRTTCENGGGTRPRHCDCRSLSPFTGTPMLFQNGPRYTFTQEEEDYAMKVLRHLLVKNDDFTTERFSEILHARMPVHSQKSWLYTLTRDRYQSRILREKNKHFNLKNENLSDREDALTDESSQRISTDSSRTAVGGVPITSTSFAGGDETGFKSDIEAIVDFFSHKYMTTENKQWNDEQLWAELDTEYTCSTEPSWKDFYSKHAKAVDIKLREDLKLQDSLSLPSDDPSLA